jgi:site-specific recombinase XerC
VIGSDLRPVEPVERYLAGLSRIERAPTTVRAYAHDLKTLWAFAESRDLRWDRVSLERLGEFTVAQHGSSGAARAAGRDFAEAHDVSAVWAAAR